jgi:hypothetical protein
VKCEWDVAADADLDAAQTNKPARRLENRRAGPLIETIFRNFF